MLRIVVSVSGSVRSAQRVRSVQSVQSVQREKLTVYKEFAIEAVVWLIPVVVLLGLAFMITA